MWVLLGQVAAGCTPMDEPAFAALVAAGHAAIEREALGRFDRVAARIRRQTPCLGFVPAPAPWAAHLVDLAVVAYFRGDDWQGPLATALRIAPDIDRGVGADHEIAGWDPGPPPDGVPFDGELYVDGAPAGTVPPDGVHLVQTRDGEELRSRVDGVEADRRGPVLGVAAIGALRSSPSSVSLEAGVDVAARLGAPVGVALEAAVVPSWADVAARAELHAGPLAFGLGPAVWIASGWIVIAPSGAVRVSLSEDLGLALALAGTTDRQWVTVRFAISRPTGERLAWQAGALTRVATGASPELTIGARVGLVVGR